VQGDGQTEILGENRDSDRTEGEAGATAASASEPAPAAPGPGADPLRQRLRRLSFALGLLALVAAFALRVRAARSTGAPLLLSQEVSPLRVLTWNVGKIYLGHHNESRPDDDDLVRIAAVIREVKPDLVALQELRDRRQLERLVGLLGEPWAGHVSDEEVNDRRAAVLLRKHPGYAFSQLVTSTGRAVAIARVEIGARPLTFISVHLDAFDARQRCAQAEEIVDWAGRAGDRDMILAGDFNFDADFLASHEPLHSDLAAYHTITAHFEDTWRGGRGTTIVDRRLDYVFSRGRLRHGNVRVLDDKAGGLMDHVPVVADFDLAPAL
jgi:endonuclease/exonuclease/phosphatase family metal-dependent hydrolase